MAGATRVDFSIHPHGHPRYNGEKKWDLVFTFLSTVKKRAFRIDVCNMCLPWAITNWVWEFYSFKNALGAHSAFTETKAWPWHWWEHISEILWVFLHFDKVNLKKKRGKPKDHDHPTQSDIHTLWFSLAVVFGETHFLVFCFTFSKKFSFNAGATRVDFSIHPHGHPRYNGEKNGIFVFTFLSTVKKRAFRIDVCNMCLPWAITNWVWEFYSFKNALGAHSLSQRPRHDLGTDGNIFLKFYEFFLHFDKVNLKKKRGNQKTMITQHNLTEETKKKLLEDVRRSSSIANFATFRYSNHSAMIRSTYLFRHYHELIESKILSCALRLPSWKKIIYVHVFSYPSRYPPSGFLLFDF